MPNYHLRDYDVGTEATYSREMHMLTSQSRVDCLSKSKTKITYAAQAAAQTGYASEGASEKSRYLVESREEDRLLQRIAPIRSPTSSPTQGPSTFLFPLSTQRKSILASIATVQLKRRFNNGCAAKPWRRHQYLTGPTGYWVFNQGVSTQPKIRMGTTQYVRTYVFS